MPTRVLLGHEVQQVLRTLPPEIKARLRATLQELKTSWPAPRSLDIAKLRSDPRQPPLFRIRVGNWRIVFRAKADTLEVVRVFHRRDGYGWMERL